MDWVHGPSPCRTTKDPPSILYEHVEMAEGEINCHYVYFEFLNMLLCESVLNSNLFEVTINFTCIYFSIDMYGDLSSSDSDRYELVW